jgi:uncharacterized protein (DUF2236 family)
MPILCLFGIVRSGNAMNVSTNPRALDKVGIEDLEKELALISAGTADSISGIFGPRSLTWRIDREAAIFLGAGRALLLQLAHPWVAAAIDQHSHAFADPIGRFHRTFGVVFAMVFGDLDESLAAARRLHGRHAAITGTLPSAAGPFAAGSTYFANWVPALHWVWATLIDTALLAYELALPCLSQDERDRYYTEARLFAAFFGIPQACLAPNWASFSAYLEDMVSSDRLSVTPTARAMAHRLLDGTDVWLPIQGSYKALTARMMPSALRDAFGLPFGETEQRAAQRLIAWLHPVYPFLPGRLRYVGPYHEAVARLAGKPRPDHLTQFSNRFWIGRPSLRVGSGSPERQR